ncbi:hypothetical protein RRG08_019505 [Elysia crispata]|uniref:Uncharacterized protein n=1 Tax=Elysia crispata TaxID=231223 RepID=A0AAE0YQV7_9GAST|nr:hypothetical protein RRG08_019505 [Elysia crispata]
MRHCPILGGLKSRTLQTVQAELMVLGVAISRRRSYLTSISLQGWTNMRSTMVGAWLRLPEFLLETRVIPLAHRLLSLACDASILWGFSRQKIEGQG